MPHKSGETCTLCRFDCSSLYSFDLSDEYLTGRLFGIFPMVRIHLAAIYYLRLASPSESPMLFLLFNWMNFLPMRRSTRPVFILQTRSRHRIFMRLDGTAHYKLRQAISRHAKQPKRRAA